MVFIVPFLNPTKMNTLLKLFGTSFLFFLIQIDYAHPDNNPVRKNRIHFIVPNISHFFPTETSMPTVALASALTIKTLLGICEEKDAILYTDAVGEKEIRLSSVGSIEKITC